MTSAFLSFASESEEIKVTMGPYVNLNTIWGLSQYMIMAEVDCTLGCNKDPIKCDCDRTELIPLGLLWSLKESLLLYR
jgi:hypothetical protein